MERGMERGQKNERAAPQGRLGLGGGTVDPHLSPEEGSRKPRKALATYLTLEHIEMGHASRSPPLFFCTLDPFHRHRIKTKTFLTGQRREREDSEGCVL